MMSFLPWQRACAQQRWTSWTHAPQCRAAHSPFSSPCCSVAQSCPNLCDPWTAARQASLSITNSRSLLKLMSIESAVPSNHLVLCRPLLLLPSIFPSIRVFSNESACECEGVAQASFFPTGTTRQSGVGSESGVGREKAVEGGRLLTPPELLKRTQQWSPLPSRCLSPSSLVSFPLQFHRDPRAQVRSLPQPHTYPHWLGQHLPQEGRAGTAGSCMCAWGRKGKMSSDASSGLGAWGVLAPNPWLSFHRLAVIKPTL